MSVMPADTSLFIASPSAVKLGINPFDLVLFFGTPLPSVLAIFSAKLSKFPSEREFFKSPKVNLPNSSVFLNLLDKAYNSFWFKSNVLISLVDILFNEALIADSKTCPTVASIALRLRLPLT